MITAATPLQDLFDLAVRTVPEVERDEAFIVKDLFRGFEWGRIHKGNRTKLGKLVYDYSQGPGAGSISPIGKTPQNQQIYRKL